MRSHTARVGRFVRRRALPLTAVVLGILAAGFSGSVAGQTPAPGDPASGRETVVAGQQYGRPLGGRVLFGQDYRDLWTVPIEVEVLDLRATAGGLRPVMAIGGNESRGLALAGGDGKSYTFRPVKKDLRGIVPDPFRDSVVAEIVEDQVAATVPLVEVIKPVLARAVGVLVPEAVRIVVLPDDPALGAFQREFAHALGVLLEYPQPASANHPGFHDASQILGHKEFWERRRASATVRADTRAFLRARLLDVFLNDWDRHDGQWRWARLPGHELLQPIPEDADMALSGYDGIALDVARFFGAPYVTFGPRYSPLPALTKNGWAVDRFLLTDLEPSDWASIAADVEARLSDPVIDEAVARLPSAYRRLDGKRLASALKQRRTALGAHARRFYRYLAREVDVHGSDEPDAFRAEWMDDGTLSIAVSRTPPGVATVAPYYRRRFDPRDTREVRLYLHGGDDTVAVSGRRAGDIEIRVIGGPGDDTVDAPEAPGLRFYDSEGRNRVVGPSRLAIDTRPFTLPSPAAPNDLSWVPKQDWGRVTTRRASVSSAVGPGVTLGAGVDSRGLGFRNYPWASRQTLDVAWAVDAAKPFIEYTGAVRREASPIQLAFAGRYSGIDMLRYFGRGNDTPSGRSDSRTPAISTDVTEVFPSMTLGNGRSTRVSIGPYYLRSRSAGSAPDSILVQERPLGFSTFSEAGFRGDASWDSRVGTDVFAPGIAATLTGKYLAKGLDVASGFGSLTGAISTSHPWGPHVVGSLRAGGKHLWGDYPFFEAAYLDHRTVAGYTSNRFAGDASLYGGADVHVILGRTHHVVPGDYGLLAFADAGRVFLQGERSSTWHPAVGAGLFFAPFKRTSVVGVRIGRNDERWFLLIETRIARLGF